MSTSVQHCAIVVQHFKFNTAPFAVKVAYFVAFFTCLFILNTSILALFTRWAKVFLPVSFPLRRHQLNSLERVHNVGKSARYLHVALFADSLLRWRCRSSWTTRKWKSFRVRYRYSWRFHLGTTRTHSTKESRYAACSSVTQVSAITYDQKRN